MALSAAAYVFPLLLLVPITGSGQSLLSGKLRQKESREILPSVSITNMTQRKINISDMGGIYRIAARPGDTITFSSTGYSPDTLVVDNLMLNEKDGYQVYLEPRSVVLPTVRIDQNNYQLDSIKRREDYKWLYPVHRRKLVGSETPTDGVGISISPIDYFSAKETQRRRLRRSLHVFLISYRPTYAFCRKASYEDIFLYINDQVRIYRKQH